MGIFIVVVLEILWVYLYYRTLRNIFVARKNLPEVKKYFLTIWIFLSNYIGLIWYWSDLQMKMDVLNRLSRRD
jgi:hypothetical protein